MKKYERIQHISVGGRGEGGEISPCPSKKLFICKSLYLDLAKTCSLIKLYADMIKIVLVLTQIIQR